MKIEATPKEIADLILQLQSQLLISKYNTSYTSDYIKKLKNTNMSKSVTPHSQK